MADLVLLTETFLLLELFFNSIVNLFYEYGVAWEQFPWLVKLLSFFVRRLIIMRCCFSIIDALLVLRCSLNNILCDVVLIVSKFSIRIKIWPCKYLKLLVWKLTDKVLILLLSVLSIFVSGTRSPLILICTLQDLSFRSWATFICVRVGVEAQSFSHPYSPLTFFHLLYLLLVDTIAICTVFLVLDYHWPIVADENFLTTHHLVVYSWPRKVSTMLGMVLHPSTTIAGRWFGWSQVTSHWFDFWGYYLRIYWVRYKSRHLCTNSIVLIAFLRKFNLVFSPHWDSLRHS